MMIRSKRHIRKGDHSEQTIDERGKASLEAEQAVIKAEGAASNAEEASGVVETIATQAAEETP